MEMSNKKITDEKTASYLLNIIMDSTEDAIVFVDKNGIIQLLSNSYAEFLGIEKSSAIGKNVRDIIENTRMMEVIKSNKSETAQLQYINGRHMVATRIPVEIDGEVIGAVGKVLFKNISDLNTLYKKVKKMEDELDLYKNELNKINSAKYNLSSIISQDGKISYLKEFIIRSSRTNSNVLILGESGTGKELFAHSVHAASRRSGEPFIKVNCGAIPYELIESELYGYEEGSFTGAKKGGKIGRFKAADRGTIFLDEIGDLPLNMQVKLLRVLQDREIEKIGSNISEPVDVRVIAATNKNLEEMVENGQFRADLYYRLNVVTINIPPLRERREDIPILAEYLVEKIVREENISEKKVSKKTIEYLKRYDWPGNVRELENILERAINFLGEEDIIEPKHLPVKITDEQDYGNIGNLKEMIEEKEKKIIIDSLIHTKGNKTMAAEILNISRTSLYEKMKKYSIDF